jgi:hypothetical protein
MLQLTNEKFEQIAAEAFEKAKAAPTMATRWANAVTKASEFLQTSAMWHLMDDDILLIVSPQSDEIYEVDEHLCERIEGERRVNCKAFAQGFPCWHRAARRLALLYASE